MQKTSTESMFLVAEESDSVVFTARDEGRSRGMVGQPPNGAQVACGESKNLREPISSHEAGAGGDHELTHVPVTSGVWG